MTLQTFGIGLGALLALVCLGAGLKRLFQRHRSAQPIRPAPAQLQRELKKGAAPNLPEKDFSEELSSMPPPRCPKCRQQMVLRRAQAGPNIGEQFWGCSAFPKCRGNLHVMLPRKFGG